MPVSRKHFSSIFSVLAIQAGLVACGGLDVTQPNLSERELNYPSDLQVSISANQVLERSHDIGAKIYEYIKSKHPNTAADFPKIRIGQVISGSYYGENDRFKQLLQEGNSSGSSRLSEAHLSISRGEETQLALSVKEVLQNVSSQFSKETLSNQEWVVDVAVNEVVVDSKVKTNAAIAYGMTCVIGNMAAGNWLMFGGFIVCPHTVKKHIEIVAIVKTNSNAKHHIVSGYGSATWASLIPETPAVRADTMTAALSAAIANAVDGVVELYENQIQQK